MDLKDKFLKCFRIKNDEKNMKFLVMDLFDDEDLNTVGNPPSFMKLAFINLIKTVNAIIKDLTVE